MTPAKTVKRTSGAIKISPANTAARTIKDTTLLVTGSLMNKTTAASAGWFRSLEEHVARAMLEGKRISPTMENSDTMLYPNGDS
jgi:hypothetical protein